MKPFITSEVFAAAGLRPSQATLSPEAVHAAYAACARPTSASSTAANDTFTSEVNVSSDAYDAIEARRENGLRAKEQIAQVVVQLLDSAGVSRYRLCKDLGLNEGNVYAWLAGDPTKVSRATARRAWEYAESCSA